MNNIDKSRFGWVGPDTKEGEKLARKSVTFWKDAFRRLCMNKAALVCGIIIIVILLLAIVMPIISPFSMREQHYSHTNSSMFTVCDQVGETQGHMHIFGTDSLGRDLFVRLWEGARVSMFIAVVAVLTNLVIGLIYGGISGYVGGVVDDIMMRIVEIINGIPYLMLVTLLKMIVGGSDPTGIISLIVAYGVSGWTSMARLVRGQIVGLKEQEFVVASKALGAKAPRLIGRHLIPNSLSIIIVEITLSIPSAIFTEAFLSFIGMGVKIPYCSWGSLASDGVNVFQSYPVQLWIPAIAISLTMLSFNILGDGMRDAFDPKLRK